MRRQYRAKNQGNRGNGRYGGFSLLDAVIASVVLFIAVLGMCSYRYSAAFVQRNAAMQTSAARVALLLCESWHGLKGAATCDPTTWGLSGISIAAADSGPAQVFENKLHSYAITTNNFNYTATLSWENVTGTANLRALNITLVWSASGSGTLSNSYILTDYVLY